MTGGCWWKGTGGKRNCSKREKRGAGPAFLLWGVIRYRRGLNHKLWPDSDPSVAKQDAEKGPRGDK